MKTNVVYVADPTKNEKLDQARVIPGTPIVLNANKPEFGSIALEKTNFNLDSTGRKGGFMSEKHIVHFVGGPVEDLKRFVEAYDLKVGDDFNAKTGLNRDIVVKESTKPSYEGATGKINPTTGEPFLTEEGEPIYRVTMLMEKKDPQCFDEILEGFSESALIAKRALATETAGGSTFDK